MFKQSGVIKFFGTTKFSVLIKLFTLFPWVPLESTHSLFHSLLLQLENK